MEIPGNQDMLKWNERPISSAGVFVLRVDGIQKFTGEIKGSYSNIKTNESGDFKSYFQMFKALQQIMDRKGKPQRNFEKRSFFAPKGKRIPQGADLDVLLPMVKEDLEFDEDPFSPALGHPVRHGKYATFFLRVICRQHASWQGHLYWSENKSEIYFRSVMELFEILAEALEAIEKMKSTFSAEQFDGAPVELLKEG